MRLESRIARLEEKAGPGAEENSVKMLISIVSPDTTADSKFTDFRGRPMQLSPICPPVLLQLTDFSEENS